MENFEENQRPEAVEDEIMPDLEDLNDMPTSLIVKSVPIEVFNDENVKAEFESFFLHFDSMANFEYIKTFKRCRVNFLSPKSATLARIHCDGLALCGNRIKVFFAQILDVAVMDESRLQPPPLEKQFLISPPASPPVGWEQAKEAEPVINFDLITRLAALATDEQVHEIHPMSTNYPAIVIHTCKDDESEETSSSGGMKRKIIQTKRPDVF